MKPFFLLIILLFALASCNNDNTKFTAEKNKSDSLQAIIDGKNVTLSFVLESFNNIENSLDSISGRQQNICMRTETPEKIKSFTIDEINKDITIINEIIKSNQQSISQLNNKLKVKNIQNKGLENSLTRINNRIVNKENELFELNNRLLRYKKNIIGLETVIGSLAWENIALTESVEEETKMLHTAYYVVGTSKELQNERIIDFNNRFVKKAKSAKINSEFDPAKFIEIDFEETTAIPVNSKSAKIITPHSFKSYHFENKNDTIKRVLITDPQKFWEASKYLVIITR